MGRKRGKQHLKKAIRRLVPVGDNPFVRFIEENEDGSSVMALTDDGAALIEQQLEAFRLKFGRDPQGSDPIFFDPDADEPTPMTEAKMRRLFLEEAVASGMTPTEGMQLYAAAESGELRDEMFTEA